MASRAQLHPLPYAAGAHETPLEEPCYLHLSLKGSMSRHAGPTPWSLILFQMGSVRAPALRETWLCFWKGERRHMHAVLNCPRWSLILLQTRSARALVCRLDVPPLEPDPASDGERAGTCTPCSGAPIQPHPAPNGRRPSTCTPPSRAPV
jgi:hypothetical protein